MRESQIDDKINLCSWKLNWKRLYMFIVLRRNSRISRLLLLHFHRWLFRRLSYFLADKLLISAKVLFHVTHRRRASSFSHLPHTILVSFLTGTKHRCNVHYMRLIWPPAQTRDVCSWNAALRACLTNPPT